MTRPCSRACTRPARVRGRRRLGYAVGLFFLAPLMGEYLLGNLKFTELYLHLSLPDARGVTRLERGSPRTSVCTRASYE